MASRRTDSHASVLLRVDMVAGQALNLTQIVGLLDADKHPKLTALLTKLKARPNWDKVFSPPKTE